MTIEELKKKCKQNIPRVTVGFRISKEANNFLNTLSKETHIKKSIIVETLLLDLEATRR